MWALIITLIVVGLLLLGAELLIIPGFGIAGILGVVTMVVSCYLAFSSFGSVAGFIIVIINIFLIVVSTILILRSKTWRKISLYTNIDSKIDEIPERKGIEIGQKGLSLTRLAPGGQARLGDVVLEVFTRDALVEPGTEIEVVEMEGNRVFVKKVIK